MAPEQAPRRRLRSIDILRGAVLGLMLFTPPTGDLEDYRVLRHAEWDGWTLSDLIFPAFLVTSGLGLAFLLRPPLGRRVPVRLVRRVLLLVLFGLAYNAYGTPDVTLATLRFTGVLQLIGVAGGVAALVILVGRRRDGRDRPVLLATAAVALVAAYGTGLEVLTSPCAADERCSPYFETDVDLLGEAHVYGAGQVGFDPEGVVVSVAAAALVLAGYLAGRHLRLAGERTGPAAGRLAAVGGVLVVGALLLDGAQPVNKRLFTPAFCVLAAGVTLVALAGCALLFDRGGRRRSRAVERLEDVAAFPLTALGRNALVVYLFERFLLQTATIVDVDDQTLQDWLLTEGLPVGEPGVHLAYSTLLLVVVLAVVSVLHARRRYVAL